MSRNLNRSWKSHLLFGVAVPLMMLFLPWVRLDKDYTILAFFNMVRKSGGAIEYATHSASDTAFVVLNYYAIWIVLVAAFAMLIRGIAGIWGKSLSTIGLLIYFCFFLYIPTFVYLSVFTPAIGMPLTLIAVVLDLVVGVYLDQREYLKADAKARKERDERLKAEKKRRMSFEGKYGRDFAIIILKNFKANLKNYILFFVNGTVAMTLYVTVLGLQDSLGGASLTGSYYQQVVMKTVNQVLPIVVVLSLLIISMTITYYVRACIESYSLYDLLGIRRSTLKIIIITEFLICIVLSLLIGLLIGELIVKRNTGEYTTSIITAIAILLYLIIIGLATLINIHVFQYSDIMKLSYPSLSEYIPGKYAKFIVPVGIVIMVIPMVRFPNQGNYEAFSMIIMELIGCLITIYSGGSVVVNHKIKVASKDELKLLNILDWRYRFRTNIRFLIIVFVLHFIAFSVCVPRLAANSIGVNAEALAPYDRVLMAYDDDISDVESLISNQAISASKYEILRATTPLGDETTIFERNYEGMLWPQGQHIIISQSEYERLCKENGAKAESLDFDKSVSDPSRVKNGEKSEHIAHIVLQQDAAVSGHKLEWYAGSHNTFRVGQPIEEYVFYERDKIFKDHEATYSRQILTGSLRDGIHENLIVVSDEYFRSVYDSEPTDSEDSRFEDVKEGPTYMYLLNYGTGVDADTSDEKLQAIADKHKDDRRLNTAIEGFYNSEKNAEWTVQLRRDNTKLNIGILAALLATSIVVMGIKYMLGIEEKKRQYTMLETLGMRRKDRKRLYNREARMLILGSYIMALVVSLPFNLGIISTRLMSSSETAMYLRNVGVIIATYTLMYVVASVIVRNTLRRV